MGGRGIKNGRREKFRRSRCRALASQLCFVRAFDVFALKFKFCVLPIPALLRSVNGA